MESRAFIVGLIVGILATVTMDVVAVIALRLGIAGRGPRRTGPDLIGRWIGYLLRGKFRHTDILQTLTDIFGLGFCPESRLTSCSVFRQTASMEAQIDCKMQSNSS